MLFLNLLVKPLCIFVIDRNVQLTTGHEEYGLYGALVSISLIFNILLDLGITNYNNKTLAAENSLIHSKLPNMIVAKSILSLVYFTVVILVALLFQYGVRALFLVFLLATVQMLNSFLMFLRSNVSAHHHFKTDAFTVFPAGMRLEIEIAPSTRDEEGFGVFDCSIHCAGQRLAGASLTVYQPINPEAFLREQLAVEAT